MKLRAMFAILTTAALAGCTTAEAPEPGDLEASTMSQQDYDYFESLKDESSFTLEDGRCADAIVDRFRGGRHGRTNTMFLQYSDGCVDGLTTVDLTRVTDDEDALYGRYYGKVLTGEGDSLVIGEWYKDVELNVLFSHIVIDTYSVEVDVEIRGMVVLPDEQNMEVEDDFVGYVAF